MEINPKIVNAVKESKTRKEALIKIKEIIPALCDRECKVMYKIIKQG